MRAVDDWERERVETCVWHTRAGQGFLNDLAVEGIARDWEGLTSRVGGDVVTDARSSWVRTRRIGPKNVYVKTYDYSSPSDRRRGWGRTTWLARSRAAREFDALQWFAKSGFPAVRPLLVAEKRSRFWGVLHRACLVTEAWGDGQLDRVALELDTAERIELVEAVVDAIRSWHTAGWRDGNLDPRNVLVRRSANGTWEVAKIDSPKGRVVSTGPAPPRDRAARADWHRFGEGLRDTGIDSKLAMPAS